MRKMTFEELERRAKPKIEIATRFGRTASIRRKPRSSEETTLLGEIISNRVEQARKSGELIRDGQRLKIRI